MPQNVLSRRIGSKQSSLIFLTMSGRAHCFQQETASFSCPDALGWDVCNLTDDQLDEYVGRMICQPAEICLDEQKCCQL